MTPALFRRSTFTEIVDWLRAYAVRLAREHDARAWQTAHLMLATGNYPRGLTFAHLLRQLLGREPGTLAGADSEAEDRPRLSVAASIAHMKAWVRAFTGKKG